MEEEAVRQRRAYALMNKEFCWAHFWDTEPPDDEKSVASRPGTNAPLLEEQVYGHRCRRADKWSQEMNPKR